MANHSLHHVLALEHLFAQVSATLREDGVFVVNDMIGRNGHQRWPEALDLLQRIWAGDAGPLPVQPPAGPPRARVHQP